MAQKKKPASSKNEEALKPEEAKQSDDVITQEQLEEQEKPEEAKQSDDVITQEQLEEQEKPEEAKDSQPVEPEEIEMKFQCGFAPAGKSNVAFTHTWQGKDYTYQLELENKVYTVPPAKMGKDGEPLPEELERIKRTCEALQANDFMAMTNVNRGVTFNKETKKYTYRVMHPEHVDGRNPINGTIALVLKGDDGKPILYTAGPNKGRQVTEQVNIINGSVETENRDIYEALLEAGFYSDGKVEKEE